MTKYLLGIGVMVFLLGIGVDLFFEWFSTGYIVSRVGMIIFAVGMLACIHKAFWPRKKENKVFKP